MPLKSSEQRFDAVCGMSARSQRDSRRPPTLSYGQAAYRANELVSILFGHADVAYEHIRPPILEDFKSFRGACSGEHVGFGLGKRRFDEFLQ